MDTRCEIADSKAGAFMAFPQLPGVFGRGGLFLEGDSV
jgi:hypothetical protein